MNPINGRQDLVIYGVNVAWISLFGILTLAFMGFRPLTLFGYTLSGVVVLQAIILIIGISSAGAVFGAQIALPTPIPPTPTPTPSITPTLTETLTPVPPSSTPTITLTPSQTLSPTVTLSPMTATLVFALIRAEFGEGAYIRKTPGGEIIRALRYPLSYSGILLTDVEHTGSLPEQFELFQNYPNPFNPTTTVHRRTLLLQDNGEGVRGRGVRNVEQRA